MIDSDRNANIKGVSPSSVDPSDNGALNATRTPRGPCKLLLLKRGADAEITLISYSSKNGVP
jgi:hypothetical protein